MSMTASRRETGNTRGQHRSFIEMEENLESSGKLHSSYRGAETWRVSTAVDRAANRDSPVTGFTLRAVASEHLQWCCGLG